MTEETSPCRPPIYSDALDDGEEDDESSLAECAIVTFGKPAADEEILKEIGEMKDNDNNKKIDKDDIEKNEKQKKKELESTEDLQNTASVSPMAAGGYNWGIDTDWANLDDSESTQLVLFTKLFLDDALHAGYDGRMMVRVSVDKDAVEYDLENITNHDINSYFINKLECDFDSTDEGTASQIGSHHPSESQSAYSVYDFISDVFSCIPGIPSQLITIIDMVGSNIGNDITVTDEDDTYHRHFRVYPEDDTYLDWSEYPQGGYPFEVSIQKNIFSEEDHWDIDTEARIRSYDYNEGLYFNTYTDLGDVDVDLSQF
ncbi:MAG: hypothetical protein AAGU27_28005 [Dehalobacterium sp.]